MSKARSTKGHTNSGKSRESQNRPSRWPWITLCLTGVVLIVATGVSASVPENGNIGIYSAIIVARGVSTLTGKFSTFFCFLLILTSLMKIAKPDEPFPRFVYGLWLLYLCTSAIYHDVTAPWDNTVLFAKTGGGGGLTGACVDWFFRIAVGRWPAIAIISCGVLVSLALISNRSPYAPFGYIWLLVVSAWKALRDFVSHTFREHGPDPDDIELADVPISGDAGEHPDFGQEDPEMEMPGSLSSTVAELRDRLQRQEDESAAGAADRAVVGIASDTGAQASGPPVAGAGRLTGETGGPSADAIEEFASLVKQPPLSESIFYEFPPLNILSKTEPQRRAKTGATAADMESRAKIIEKTLLSFGIVAKVVNFSKGPAVTRFELQPGPGVKVATIVNLSQDLALALAAQDVRIEAPIPGKSAIGIEVPNKEISLVHLRDVLETREFQNSPSPLTVALGKDISGRPVITTLDHCLHLLIAGATGAGKSVCINSIISSILYKARPDQVKLLLIDPKRVELSTWAKVPHLIAPVVFDPKKASGALRWSIKEMESRYEKFTKVGTRDIDRYNQIASPGDGLAPAMPYIVIIIDELSDLMMVAPAEVEDSIFRLAQMARAAGIYLVVATQRPSVDVLTGTIKANIPSRIAFAVASQIDSRTILDMGGAEKLLGRGDMLFSPVGSTKPLRAQGCYISEREIDELVSFVSSQAKPQYATGILSQPEVTEKEVEIQADPLFSQALRIVVEAKQASVSLLQRKLPIGYSRAARLIDAMETKGYVGPYEGSKPREVRMTFQEYMQLFEDGNSGESPSPEASGSSGFSEKRSPAGKPSAQPPGKLTGPVSDSSHTSPPTRSR